MPMTTRADRELFAATVPVFRDYAPRLVRLAALADARSVPLDTRLAPDTFGAGEHLVVAQGFVLRTVFPVIGRDCPAPATDEPTREGIVRRDAEIAALLGDLGPDDFAGAAARRIVHVAGTARLTQDAADYVRLFGVPNFFFHLVMGYATLRAAGVEVGKAEFDGLHRYAPGFSFRGTHDER